MEEAMAYIGCYGLSSLIGGVGLYIIVRKLFNWILPEPPIEVMERLRQVNEATASGDWYGDSDIYALDMALAKAELENPGSTLRVYFERFRMAFALGCMLISLSANGCIMASIIGLFPVNPTLTLSVVGLVLGLSLLFSFLWVWLISRPRLR